jgi:hypoxanthine phosphoribosyltransferase
MTQAYHADSSDLAEKEVLSWELFGTACRELATQVADSGFEPEILIAVARGGLLPGGGLSYALGVKLTDAINVEFYTDVHETLPDPVLLAPLLDTDSIKGRRLLVVDDVADSGRTLALVLELLREHGAECRSAVIYAKSRSEVDPDYVWRRTDEWIVFPWSAQPPVTGQTTPARTDGGLQSH